MNKPREDNKLGLTIASAALISLFTGGAATLYKHELAILSNARHIERLKIKDYRQHRDVLRARGMYLANQLNTLEAVIEIEPDVFGPNSALVIKNRKAQLVESRARLENYVEENKHGGRDD